jgi:hypothetical protein
MQIRKMSPESTWSFLLIDGRGPFAYHPNGLGIIVSDRACKRAQFIPGLAWEICSSESNFHEGSLS